MFDAAERGNSELFPRLWKANPELLWRVNSNKKTIFQVAVECRQEKVYSLIYGLTADHKKVIANAADDKNNSVVHLAAVLSPSAKLDHISGGALHMQRELQWFKELESLSPLCLEYSNTDEKKPGELFTESHKELMKEGEMWMKDTATSCTVVGGLIITMMFATAFAIPGGNNGDTGLPIFIEYKLFMVFIISAAVSLFSSTTSVLMFLGILITTFLSL
ncbi:uncharacterized protein LOC112199320 [Rosa chinensis]|nr:uncharacterized protein LOC112199320 [Rosa chinensis]